MHDDRSLVEGRVSRLLSQRLRPAVHAARTPLTLAAWHVPGEPVDVAEALAATYQPFATGAAWGRPWSTTWLRVTGEVPADWAGRRVEAVFDLGFGGDWPGFQAEGLAFTADGTPVKGIEPGNRYVPVANPAAGGERVDLFLELAANPDVFGSAFRPTPLGDVLTAGDDLLYVVRTADLVVLDEDVRHLVHDVEVLDGLMRKLSTDEPRRFGIVRALDRAMDALDLDDVNGTAAAARAELADVLTRPAVASAHTVSAVGHAHIDSAWLWPVRETVRKAARTFANVTALAQEYPELVFACSQAQQYAWVKQTQPEIYRRMQQAARAGQWVPVGGMWVEADGNLPGGEAMVRQLVAGKSFLLEEFGYECRGVWLPDSFGYSAAWPQIARLAGMDWFLTQKISWNQTNRFPHHTFWWEGIDGTRIFTHFPPADTYNGVIDAEELTKAVRQYAEKGRGTRSILPFGHGDGGGGPTREMLERARRFADLEGAPRVVVEDPNTFFEKARAEYPDAPVWSGELYLEFHRGTYTSQHRTKAGNRRSEHLLREAELWATTAALHVPSYSYPYDDLDRLWKTVLLNQFHDILPGSSIAWVHREAEQTYAEVAAGLEAVTAAALRALVGDGDGYVVANTAPHDRTDVVSVDGTRLRVRVPASGLAVADPQTPSAAALPGSGVVEVSRSGAAGGAVVLANGLLTVTVDADGLLASVVDEVHGRQVLAPGTRGNLLQLHTDLPNRWDAWDVDRHYRNRVVDLVDAVAVTVVGSGPLVGAVRVVRTTAAGSTIDQTYTLRAGSARLDVSTEVDWREREKMLKAAFALDVHADRAASEIQFGHVFRPTHANTSWDAARFETAMHRWVHVGEPGYGVAVTNDSTYGHDTTRSSRDDGGTTTTVRLSLLRAPRFPDPDADQGRHVLGYALVPGVGVDGAVRAGYETNLGLRVVPAAADAVPPAPVVTVSGGGATLEAVKLAQDRSGDVVVRLYEAHGGRATARVRPGFEVAEAHLTDLLERRMPDEPAPERDGADLLVPLRPFRIVTLRLVPRG